MYNRYIPEDASYTRVQAPSQPRRSGTGARQQILLPDFLSGKGGLDVKDSLSGLLKSLHLDKIDAGDVLLLLIMLYLLVEGDSLELVIALGLTLLMGLGDGREE